MPDYIGNIPVPEVLPSGVFPLEPDYPHGRAHRPEVVVHQFGGANAKIEQRFLLGTGAKRFTVRKAHLRESDRIALRDFWESKAGPYGVFTYNAPNDDGNGTTPYTCRFANEPLSWEMLSDAVCTVGVTLIGRTRRGQTGRFLVLEGVGFWYFVQRGSPGPRDCRWRPAPRYQRGNARQFILSSDSERRVYLDLLRYFASISGIWRAAFTPMTHHPRDSGFNDTSPNWTMGSSRSWFLRSAPSTLLRRK